MAKTHLLRATNKPDLFSFDQETEFANVDKWVLNQQRYTRRSLETEAATLKQLVTDFIVIIDTGCITDEQLQHFCHAVENGASGVWEPAVSKLELICWHFESARKKVMDCIFQLRSAIAERFLNCVSEAFNAEEQMKILAFAFQSKSIKMRVRAATVIYNLNNASWLPFLQHELLNQSNEEVKEAIQFAIDEIKNNL